MKRIFKRPELIILILIIAIGNSCIEEDTTPPVLTLNGELFVQLDQNGVYTEEGATASDDTDGDITDRIVISNGLETADPGNYKIVYTVTDMAGNTTIKKRTVEVINTVPVPQDTTPPVITLFGPNPLFIPNGQPYMEPGASAWDAADGDLTPAIIITGNVDTHVHGFYEVTYKVSDLSGNTAQVIRNVTVSF